MSSLAYLHPHGTETVSESIKELFDIHTYKRQHRSATEKEFVANWIIPLGVEADEFGNMSLRIGADPIAWCCHIDTQHRNNGKQGLSLTNNMMRVRRKERSNSGCLGADDGAGIWLMREMIKAKKPGLYLFHRGEEMGGLGSRWLVENKPTVLNGINAAVAFDRHGTTSVITHQARGRCCSDNFGKSLAIGLGNGFRLDTGGIFTDTANYIDIVPECTNISVGYYHEHTHREELDIVHILKLREALINLDTGKLVIERDPSKDDYEDDLSWFGRGFYRRNLDLTEPRKTIITNVTAVDTRLTYDAIMNGGGDDQMPSRNQVMYDLVRENPWEVAQILLHDYGLEPDDLLDQLYQMGAAVPYGNY